MNLSQCAESSAKQDKQNLLHNTIVKLTSYMELQANYNKYDVKIMNYAVIVTVWRYAPQILSYFSCAASLPTRGS